MPRYDLDGLGEREFEHLCQTLLKAVIGNGTITFGEGPDGAREATFQGKAPYPSTSEQWTGFWIFQAKFHNTKLGVGKAREQLIEDLRKELYKIIVKYKRKCDNYILITNVPLSSVNKTGTHDLIDQVVSKYKNYRKPLYRIPSNVHVWGADDLFRFLERYGEIRRSYFNFITPGDLIAELLERLPGSHSNLAETIKMYISTCFEREQYAQLDQAGEVSEDKILLKKVFVDLDVTYQMLLFDAFEMHTVQYAGSAEESLLFSSRDKAKAQIKVDKILPWAHPYSSHEESTSSAMVFFLHEITKKIILIGGPGQGKSTLCQYLAQIHRSTLLGQANQLSQNFGLSPELMPLVGRIPFRIILKEYAQWITNAPANNESIEHFLVEKIRERTARTLSPEDIQTIFKNNPCLLIFDGLDEVTNVGLQDKMLEIINDFLIRCEKVLNADLQVIATSRPTGYRHRLDALGFTHLTLTTMNKKRVIEYTERWKTAKLLDEEKTNLLLTTMNECLEDPQIQPLTNTPLQVTILILIILTGGTPPRQREALFEEYLDIIYRREKTKAKWIMQTEKRMLFGLHKYLGYILHARAAGKQNVRSVIKEADFIREVRNYISFNDKYTSPAKFDELVDQIVKEARERLVLIVELEPKVFGFELRSLQEFFAAAHLADTAKNTIQRYRRFNAIARPAHWRNVALLFAGRVGRSYGGEASNIIEVCKEIDREEPESFLKTGAWLGLEIAADRCFVPNRNLQRSIIEYSLSMLDGEFLGRVYIVTEALLKLQKEDLKDHVKPLLEEKLLKCRFSSINIIADIYHSLFKSTSKLLEQIEVYLLSEKQEEVNWALRKSLDYKAPSNWLATRLPKIVENMPSNIFADIFSFRAFEDPEYLKKCLANCQLSDENISALSYRLLLHINSWYVVDKLPVVASIDLSTSQSQMWTEVSFLRILAYLRSKSFRNPGKSISYSTKGEIVAPLNEWIARSKIIAESSQKCLIQVGNITSILTADSILPTVKLCLWILELVHIPYERSELEGFVSFYQASVETNEELSEALYQWTTDAGSFCAFPYTLVHKLEERNSDIQQYINNIYNVSQWDLEQIYPIITKKSKLSKNETTRIITYIENSFVQKTQISVNTCVMQLMDESWDLHPDVVSALDKLLDAVDKNYVSCRKDANLLLKRLFLRLLHTISDRTPETSISYGNQINDPLQFNNYFYEQAKGFPENTTELGLRDLYYKLLRIIGQKDLDLYFGRDYHDSDMFAAFFAVSKLHGHYDKDIDSGATKIASAIISSIISHRRPWQEETITELRKKVKFKIRILKKQINYGINKEDNIKLLFLSNLSCIKLSAWLLKFIREVKSPDEVQSWAFFIKWYDIADNIESIERTSEFLSAIIGERTINQAIRVAALNRYTMLYQKVRLNNRIDEQRLDLPLSKLSET